MLHTASRFYTFSLITITPTIWNMVEPWKARESARLEVECASVDINDSYATHSKFRNKSKIPDTAKENTLPSTQASNNTNTDDAVTPLNLDFPLRDSLELIILSDASQNFTEMWCYFDCLWYSFIDYVNDPALDVTFIYVGNILFQYNKEEGTYTEFLGNPTATFLATSRDHEI